MRWVGTQTYDRQGHMVESRFDGDDDGDGTVDESDVNTFVYGQRGQVVKVTVAGPYGGYVETLGYDGQGRARVGRGGRRRALRLDDQPHPDL